VRASLPAGLKSLPPVPGDVVVHLDYGLCRMGELEEVTLSDATLHTLTLTFRDDDTLRVPVSDAVRIWNYGAELTDNQLDQLGDPDWLEGQAERVSEIRESFRVLTDRRRAREARSGFSVTPTSAHLKLAARDFPHTLTDDQSLALADILTDLKHDSPTNRLLLGDVGCGKTEVAVQAAFAIILSGGKTGLSVRLAAPTRVLANQHFNDIKPRADALGLTCELYTGDTSDTDKDVICGDLPDFLIGTHGVLGDRFAQCRFGLTLIDEEQKFGAKLKSTELDSLASGNLLRLSATPIPRTLAEARVGLADVSLIRSYPSGRGKTATTSVPDSDSELRKIVARELDRDGQVIAIVPRIRDIKALRRRLAKLFPDASIKKIHGKRKPKQNRRAIARFREGRTDILVATSMLETGINIANANTMVVFGPDRFGLGQLHQLRGRIGRSTRNAHFTLLVDDEPTDDFTRRLRVLEDLQRRGQGLQLSIADSLMRGSGTLTDDEQSGHASSIGIELFEHLLGVAEDAADPFASIPNITGDLDWQVDGETALSLLKASRDALEFPDTFLVPDAASYPALVAACRHIGAHRVGISDDGFSFVLAAGEKLGIDGSLDDVIARITDHAKAA